MEIYKDLSNPASKEFEKLLSNQLSKIQIEEGKIIDAKINKITDKYVFLEFEGLKSEPILDITELKNLGLNDQIKIGGVIPVLLEKIEDKNGEVVVSASKARKIVGWEKLVKAYENNEPVNGKIISKVKGGCVVEHIDTGSLMFLPGSQISDKPLKDISSLMNEPQKFALIKIDRQRGNVCVSRKEIVSKFKSEDKAKILNKYNIGDVIKGAEVKSFSSFGAFFNVDGLFDCLVHTMEISYSRINSPDEILSVGQKCDLKIISKDMTKLQIGCSLKQMLPNPFDNIDNYEVGKIYKVKISNIKDFGAFVTLEEGLVALLHNSELHYTKKNITAKKMFNLNQEIDVMITEIDKEKSRIAVSYKLTQKNPYEEFSKEHPVNSEFEAEVVNKNEYSLFVKSKKVEVDAFLHCNDLTYSNSSEEELNKYKKGDLIKVKVIEIKEDEQKIRVSHKATLEDPFEYFKDKKVNQTITVKIISTDNKGLVVKPEGCEMDFLIKKSQIAINSADARPGRFVGGEKVDCAIQELDLERRKVSLSMRLLEELAKAEALEKYGDEGSGKNLPFATLSEDLKKKEDK